MNVKTLSTGTEKELRGYKLDFPKTLDEAIVLIKAVVNREHTYGTSAYAASISSTLIFNWVCHELGLTGFQASCADLDILRRTRNMEMFRIIKYENLLYPQYLNSDNFPTIQDLEEDPETRKWLKKEATKRLGERGEIHPVVKDRWEYLSKLEL